jgi:hypothetical protein
MMAIKFFISLLLLYVALGSGTLPDPKKTPGDIIPGTALCWVCNKWIDSYPIPMKSIITVYKNYKININDKSYSINRLIPVSLGGSNDIKNLWPIRSIDLYRKIKVENDLFRCVCNGLMPLKEAQAILVMNWKAWNIDSLK